MLNEIGISQSRRKVIVMMDRLIVALMVAVLLVLSGPVCLSFWERTHTQKLKLDSSDRMCYIKKVQSSEKTINSAGVAQW